MPFDGADFLQWRLSERSAISDSPEEIWHWPLRSFFKARRTDVIIFPILGESAALAALRTLAEARRLIETPEHWVQRAYEAFGERYCAMGALRAVGRRSGHVIGQDAAERLLLTVARQHGFRSVQRMNDRSTHEQVLAAFDEAMAAARQQARVPEAVS